MLKSLIALFMLRTIYDFNVIKLGPKIAADVAQINLAEFGTFCHFLLIQAATLVFARQFIDAGDQFVNIQYFPLPYKFILTLPREKELVKVYPLKALLINCQYA